MIQIGDKSLVVFEAAPLHLQSAEGDLDQAEADFSEGVFAPFWDSVERAATFLGHFDECVRQIHDGASHYEGLMKVYDTYPPRFPLSSEAIARLSTASGTAERMRHIVRTAQKNYQFATIFEQRKTTQVLIAGFTSLGQALDEMTQRIATSLNNLATSVDNMGSSLNDSVRAVDARLGEMQAATAHHRDAEMVSEKARTVREEASIAMLDNIQRHRKPWP
jgi:hypothetical protein